MTLYHLHRRSLSLRVRELIDLGVLDARVHEHMNYTHFFSVSPRLVYWCAPFKVDLLLAIEVVTLKAKKVVINEI